VTLWAAAWLLWMAPVGLAPAYQGSLAEARIQITVSGDTARVIAWYRFAGTADSLRLAAFRPQRQALVFHGVAGAAQFRLDTLSGLFRLVTRQTDAAPALDVRYDVTGSLSRIPLFVPDVPTTPGSSDVLIRVAGLGASRVAAYPFPRFRREPGDGWLAHPDHLPSFIVLARTPASLPVPAVVQWSVVVLVLVATGAWLSAQWRHRSGP
jgi:hypothetical protein